MIQLRQLSLTDSLLPFLYPHSLSICLSSLSFFLLVFEFGIGVWGAFFSTDQQSRRWVGSSSLDIRGMVFFIILICPFVSGRFTTIDTGRLFDLHWVNIFSFLLWSSGLLHDSLFFSDLLHLISIYEKVVGLCSTTCMYHGRRLSDIHTRFIELFRFSIFLGCLFFYIISQRVPAVPMCSMQCQCQFIYSNLVWYYMSELLYYVIIYRGIQVPWFIATLIGFSIIIQ